MSTQTSIGQSGSGKSKTIQALVEEFEVNFVEINDAQLTKEGTSGNSLSKALSPLSVKTQSPTLCFVEEFDKLFISGKFNDSEARESTTEV